jgi:hypothetical protein
MSIRLKDYELGDWFLERCGDSDEENNKEHAEERGTPTLTHKSNENAETDIEYTCGESSVVSSPECVRSCIALDKDYGEPPEASTISAESTHECEANPPAHALASTAEVEDIASGLAAGVGRSSLAFSDVDACYDAIFTYDGDELSSFAETPHYELQRKPRSRVCAEHILLILKQGGVDITRT